MVKNRAAYSLRRYKAVEMKLQDIVQNKYAGVNIKNKTQVETWFRWYKNGEIYQAYQQVGETIFL